MIAVFYELLQKERNDMLVRGKPFMESSRDMTVVYIFGPTGCGKTRSLWEKYGSGMHRVTDYTHPFDGYHGEDILVFDNFDSDCCDARTMYKYLSGSPLLLSARDYNRIACYTTVFLVSLHPLEKQYTKDEIDQEEIFRKIDHVIEFSENGEYKDWGSAAEYLNRR